MSIINLRIFYNAVDAGEVGNTEFNESYMRYLPIMVSYFHSKYEIPYLHILGLYQNIRENNQRSQHRVTLT